jgi:ABC-type bacteriocin/lantibiotic exporter with double-glycine peptidase domain
MNSKPPFCAQERSDTCMLACLRMILAHAGTVVSETALVQETSLEEAGLDPDQLAHLAQHHGLHAQAQQVNLETIAGLVSQERFPIVLLDRTGLDGEFAVHAVIPIRFSRYYVMVLDPLRGERRVTIRKFEEARRRVANWAVVWERE